MHPSGEPEAFERELIKDKGVYQPDAALSRRYTVSALSVTPAESTFHHCQALFRKRVKRSFHHLDHAQCLKILQQASHITCNLRLFAFEFFQERGHQ